MKTKSRNGFYALRIAEIMCDIFVSALYFHFAARLLLHFWQQSSDDQYSFTCENEQQMSSKHDENITNGFYQPSTLEIMCDMQKTDKLSRRKSAPKLMTDFRVLQTSSFHASRTKIATTLRCGEPHVHNRAQDVHFDSQNVIMCETMHGRTFLSTGGRFSTKESILKELWTGIEVYLTIQE